jgi:hypothetical protein
MFNFFKKKEKKLSHDAEQADFKVLEEFEGPNGEQRRWVQLSATLASTGEILAIKVLHEKRDGAWIEVPGEGDLGEEAHEV